MNDSLFDRIKPMKPGANGAAEEGEDGTDYGVFGFLHGIRDRSPMIEFRLKTGDSVAYPYAILEKATFDRSHGITLVFGGRKVIIEGERLNQEHENRVRLYLGIVRQRITWIQEPNRTKIMSGTETAPSITRIHVE